MAYCKKCGAVVLSENMFYHVARCNGMIEASSADECDHVFAGPAGFKDAPCLKCGVLWSVAETESKPTD